MNNNLGNKETMARNIKYYMDLHNIDRKELSKAIGVPYTTVTDWLKAKTYPRIDSIEVMSTFFGISKADLVEDHSRRKVLAVEGKDLTKDEVEIIKMIRKMNKEEMIQFILALQNMKDKGDS